MNREAWRFEDLTVPRPGSQTTRTIWSAALRSTMRSLLRLPTEGLPEALVTQYAAVAATLAALAREAPGAFASLARRPNVATLVTCLQQRRADIDRTACLAQLIGAVGFELVAMGCAERFSGELPATRWTSWVERGAVDTLEAGGSLEFRADGKRGCQLRVQDEHGPLFAAITPTATLVRADDSPLAGDETHPDKAGNAVDLGGRSVEEWVTALQAALDVIGAHAPGLLADIEVVLQQVVPVGYDATRHLSASYAENLGTIYLSLHDDVLTMAEAIVHEVSHNKLNALWSNRPLLRNAFEPLYTSPVRPDPRPLHGILLAVHAFGAVGFLYERLRAADDPRSHTPAFARRHDAIRSNNAEGLAVLQQHADATAEGQSLLDELTRLIG